MHYSRYLTLSYRNGDQRRPMGLCGSEGLHVFFVQSQKYFCQSVSCRPTSSVYGVQIKTPTKHKWNVSERVNILSHYVASGIFKPSAPQCH